ncbi:regulator of chromosome condensation domain-containing protein [Tieghemostelium lacteum]|uniref:Regulator of chromosome condensation domain-containing protein n=1 Tax=Tieghemostelium lacteum TaxID=361077 RepID=A0A152A354_TIELA|nr:regulator of chromosome condensation domain-containing protein [Tieghemostelium lacteum]|eukprot:KYR00678.1 regulator of chromosome condensation domain-containing protein [Tieghemostelium lacteum]
MSELYSWGSGSNGQLALNNQLDISIPTLVRDLSDDNIQLITDIVGGGSHTLFLLSNGQIYSCGLNDCGQLGYKGSGITNLKPLLIEFFDQNQIKIQSVCAGWNSTIALDTNGQLWSFGSNSHSQLAQRNSNSIKKKIVLKKKSTTNTTTSTTKESSESLPSLVLPNCYYTPQLVVALKGIGIVAVASGMRHSIALDNCGRVYVWGCNKFGQLYLDKDTVIIQNEPTKLDLPDKVIQIACGSKHSCLILQTECGQYNLLAAGSNKYGQLANDDTFICKFTIPVNDIYSGSSISKLNLQCGWSNTCLLIDKNLFICGRSEYGQLGNGNTQNVSVFKLVLSDVDQYSIGSEHVLD